MSSDVLVSVTPHAAESDMNGSIDITTQSTSNNYQSVAVKVPLIDTPALVHVDTPLVVELPPSPNVASNSRIPSPKPKSRSPSPIQMQAHRTPAAPVSKHSPHQDPTRFYHAKKHGSLGTVVDAHKAAKGNVSGPPDAVSKYMKSNPNFAEEFSRTIPISPPGSPVPTFRPEINDSSSDDGGVANSNNNRNRKPNPPPAKKRPAVVIEDDFGSGSDEQEELEADDGPNIQIPDEEDDSSDDQEEEKPTRHKSRPNGSNEYEQEPEVEEDDQAADAFFGEEEGQDEVDSEPEADDDDGQGSEATTAKGQGQKPKKKLTEEEEALEKMLLMEEIQEAIALGIVPPQQPNYNMSLEMLRQIKAFQDEKKSEMMNVKLMGMGLVNLIGFLEGLNGRFDPFKKIFGSSLELQGAKNKIEANLDAYKSPFVKIYRKMRKNGTKCDLPPWAEIVMATGFILKDVHMENQMKKMREQAKRDMSDPEVQARARLLYAKAMQQQAAAQQQAQVQRTEATQVPPYHTAAAGKVDIDAQFNTFGQRPGASQSVDDQREAQLAQEFAGFDKLPSLSALAQKTNVSTAAMQAQVPVPKVSAAAACTTSVCEYNPTVENDGDEEEGSIIGSGSDDQEQDEVESDSGSDEQEEGEIKEEAAPTLFMAS